MWSHMEKYHMENDDLKKWLFASLVTLVYKNLISKITKGQNGLKRPKKEKTLNSLRNIIVS